MLGKYKRSTALLVLSLLLLPLAHAGGEQAPSLPNMFYTQKTETADSQIIESRVYVKDGAMFLEIQGELWKADSAYFEMLQSAVSEHMEELLDQWETEEVGPQIVNGWETTLYRTYLRATGQTVAESWHNPDIPVPVMTINYGEDGAVTDKTYLIDFSAEPDFGGLDFGLAKPMPFLSQPEKVEITREEFENLAPWYDTAQAPLEGFKLDKVWQEFGFFGQFNLRHTLTYADPSESLRVLIYGQTEKIGQTFSAADFWPLDFAIITDQEVLRPALNSDFVRLGFADPIDLKQGRRFLWSVISPPNP